MNKSLSRLILVITLCVALMIGLAATFNFLNVWIALGATAISLMILLNSLSAIIDWTAKPVKEEPIPKKKTRKKPTK
jgi:hypothetical protein